MAPKKASAIKDKAADKAEAAQNPEKDSKHSSKAEPEPKPALKEEPALKKKASDKPSLAHFDPLVQAVKKCLADNPPPACIPGQRTFVGKIEGGQVAIDCALDGRRSIIVVAHDGSFPLVLEAPQTS